jgi:hypothetical protein
VRWDLSIPVANQGAIGRGWAVNMGLVGGMGHCGSQYGWCPVLIIF